MVELNLFRYHHRESFLNKAHPVAKLIALFLLSSLLLKGSPLRIAILLVLLVVSAFVLTLPLKHYLRELRFFMVMALMIGGVRLLVTHQIIDALTAMARFITIVLLGILFSDSTAPDDLARAFPRWGAPLQMTLAIIPLVSDSAFQISQARKARGESPWSNPFKRIASYVTSLLDLLLEKSGELEEALKARCYDPKMTYPSLKVTYRDYFLVVGILMLTLLLFLFT
jgi:energy-coupling factor transporter transmembrane protein EcfT